MKSSKRETIIGLLILATCLTATFLGLSNRNNQSTELKLNEKKLSNKLLKNEEKIMAIGLDGAIMGDFTSGSPFETNLNAASAKAFLLKALEKDNIKGVLLRVNSPGGTVASSQEIYQIVMKLRAKGKAVVVSMNDICASGCYYISSAADHIVANRGTLTGSIGVVSSGLKVKELYRKIGLEDRTFKAGKYKDLGNMAQDMSIEEKAIYQAILDDTYEQFIADVAKGRGLKLETTKKLAEGLIYTGQQAKKVKLVDQLGTYLDAKEALYKVMENKYNITNARDLSIDETWKANSFSGFENLLGLGLGSKVNLNKILNFGELFTEKKLPLYKF